MDISKLITDTINSLYDLYLYQRDSSIIDDELLIRLLETANSLYDNNSSTWQKINPETLQKLQSLNKNIPSTRQKFKKEDSTKKLLANLGLYICDSLEAITDTNGFFIINQTFDAFRNLIRDYVADTHDIPEDLGISLGEAITMKEEFLRKSNLTIASEWQGYLQTDKDRLLLLL